MIKKEENSDLSANSQSAINLSVIKFNNFEESIFTFFYAFHKEKHATDAFYFSITVGLYLQFIASVLPNASFPIYGIIRKVSFYSISSICGLFDVVCFCLFQYMVEYCTYIRFSFAYSSLPFLTTCISVVVFLYFALILFALLTMFVLPKDVSIPSYISRLALTVAFLLTGFFYLPVLLIFLGAFRCGIEIV
jgi:hypothetical protein